MKTLQLATMKFMSSERDKSIVSIITRLESVSLDLETANVVALIVNSSPIIHDLLKQRVVNSISL